MILLCYCKDSWVVFEISLSNTKVVLESRSRVATTTTYCIFYLGIGKFWQKHIGYFKWKSYNVGFLFKNNKKII